MRASTQRTLGATGASRVADVLSRPAHPESLPPPLPAELAERFEAVGHLALAELSLLDVEGIERSEGFHPGEWFGPFWRCFDVIVPEWLPGPVRSRHHLRGHPGRGR